MGKRNCTACPTHVCVRVCVRVYVLLPVSACVRAYESLAVCLSVFAFACVADVCGPVINVQYRVLT